MGEEGENWDKNRPNPDGLTMNGYDQEETTWVSTVNESVNALKFWSLCS